MAADHIFEPGHSWFVVLPDIDRCRSMASVLCNQDPQIIRYESGRPFVVGRWPAGSVTSVQVGPMQTTVIGHCSIGATELVALLKTVADVSNIDRLACRLQGSFHLVASVAGETRVQGAVSALRQVSYVKFDGFAVAADSASMLASLTGAVIDRNVLALRMAYPQLPYPLDDQSMWQGVHNLPSDSYLVLGSGADPRVRRWWFPPEPVLSLAEGADAVRQALIGAMAIRVAESGLIGADLSGGMDSTSLCFLSASDATRLLTVRRVEADLGSDDDRWASYAAERLPGGEHVVFSHSEAPTIYADLADAAKEHIDEPYRWIRTWRRHKHLAAFLAERGCRQHITGHGGDELFGVFPSYLHTLARTHPRIAARHLRGFQALRQWPWRDTAHALADRATFTEWLTTSAARLCSPLPRASAPHFSWGWPARMPPWATSGAVEAARDLFRGAAVGTPAPLANSRAQHEALQYIRTCGRAVRQMAAMASTLGVQLAAPYLDDRVLEAALSVHLHERMTPWRYKPLLTTAMSGIVPDKILGRTTKGDFTADVYVGLKQNRTHLLRLMEDSVLARNELIDLDVLRKSVLDVHPTFGTLIPLERTMACETWLRAARNTCPASHAGSTWS